MVKAYLRYEQSAVVGVIFSPSSSVLLDQGSRLAVCGALEALNVWNIKQGVLVSSLIPAKESPHEKPTAIIAIAASPDDQTFAAGYTDGSIRIWDIRASECKVTLRGHRSPVVSLVYNADGSRLASGGADTDIILWDVLAQAGLYRLRGHVGAVTNLRFIGNRLLSASKDTFIKVWELETQHCCQTLVGHQQEVWSLDVDPSGELLVSGSTDTELRIWSISPKHIEFLGCLVRQDRFRVGQIHFHKDTLGVQGTGRLLEMWKVRTSSMVASKVQRRIRRLKESLGKDKLETPEAKDRIEAATKVTASDHFKSLPGITTDDNQRGFAFAAGFIVIGLASNSLRVYSLQATKASDKDAPEAKLCYDLIEAGHRYGVRAAALSRDGTMLATVAKGSIKIWNTYSQKCIRTLSSGYGLCCSFVPGDQHVLVGTKTGELDLYSVAGAELLHRVAAHSGALWSIDLQPNGAGFATGGADKEVKFWSFELIQDDDLTQRKRKKTLGVVHTRTLRLTDDVLCLKYSPDGRYIAAAILDSTIKVFHEDSLKFFLTLYGHKFPVLCMDISSDGTLLCSAGVDKNLKIWGMDFGDCHKSMLAHDDSIMGCKFLPDTHHILTCSKDKQIRFWDGDKFQHVYSLIGHQAEIWGMAVSQTGDMFASVSNDCSIRIWNQSEEQVFLEAERENRLEEMFEEGAVEEPLQSIGAIPESGIVDPKVFESTAALEKPSVATVKSGERLMEAIDFIETDRAALEESKTAGKKHRSNPMMLGLSHFAFLLRVLRAARPSELDVILMVLPFTYAKRLILLMQEVVDAGGDGIEISVRSVLFLLQVHHQRILASGELASNLVDLRDSMRNRVRAQKDLIGYNIAALDFLKDDIQLNSDAVFYEDRKALTSAKF